jgi:predicted GNAT superfamily acetyltransferase
MVEVLRKSMTSGYEALSSPQPRAPVRQRDGFGRYADQNRHAGPLRKPPAAFGTVCGVTIRDMVEADLPQVMAINEANVPEVGDIDLEQLRFIVSESAARLVVEVDGAIAGFCLVLAPGSAYDSINYAWFMERYPTDWYLDRVAFDAATQGKGFGSQLYAEVELRLTAAAATGLTLEVNIDPPNEPSLAFHDKHGFAEVGQQTSHDIEVSLMRKSAR